MASHSIGGEHKGFSRKLTGQRLEGFKRNLDVARCGSTMLHEPTKLYGITEGETPQHHQDLQICWIRTTAAARNHTLAGRH